MCVFPADAVQQEVGRGRSDENQCRPKTPNIRSCRWYPGQFNSHAHKPLHEPPRPCTLKLAVRGINCSDRAWRERFGSDSGSWERGMWCGVEEGGRRNGRLLYDCCAKTGGVGARLDGEGAKCPHGTGCHESRRD